MDYQKFKQARTGGRIDYDNVYAYQCVDLILQYIKDCYGISSGVWGNAIDYWNKTSTPLLAKFDKLSTRDLRQGDIAILNGLSGNPYGHIGIVESQSGDTFKMLEQNGAGSGSGTGRDAIGVYRDIPKSRLAGILRPKGAPVPPPQPAPARGEVFLPGTARSWNLYHIGSYLRPRTADVKAVLSPALYGGLTYKIEGWVGNYGIIITTQMFGRGVIWVRDTEAVIK